MAKLTITITMDNSAFADFPEVEVSRLLKEYVKIIESRQLVQREFLDINGNIVGTARIQK